MCVYIYIYISIYLSISLSMPSSPATSSSTPDPPTKIITTKTRWLKLSGKFPMDVGIPPLMIKIVLQSNPLKYIIFVRRLAVPRSPPYPAVHPTTFWSTLPLRPDILRSHTVSCNPWSPIQCLGFLKPTPIWKPLLQLLPLLLLLLLLLLLVLL